MDIELLKKNLETVKRNIAETGKTDVQIVAAVKTQSIETVDMLMSLDDSIVLGENRVQELVEKYNPRYRWHFIGQLQTNKVKKIVGKVELIHSLDRLNLAEELDLQAEKLGKQISALVEINIGGEASKGGVEPSGFREFLKRLSDFPNICVEGIMSVAPAALEGEKLDDCFKSLYNMYLEAKAFKSDNFNVKTFSAGMTHDYVTAVKNGANTVRIGRALFGERI